MSISPEPGFHTFLKVRRSSGPLQDPAPSREQLNEIFAIAGTAPDHGSLRPYRFVVFEGASREKLADAMVDAGIAERGPVLDESLVQKIRAKAFVAPMQVLIIASPVAGKIPDWEQNATAACAGFGVVLGANALGFGAVWKSLAFGPGPKLKELCQLKDGESFLGWVNIGRDPAESRGERRGLDLARHVLHYS